MKTLKTILYSLIFSVMFVSCEKDEPTPPDDPPIPTPVSGVLSRMDIAGDKFFEVKYNSSNLPVKIIYYTDAGNILSNDTIEYNSSNKIKNIYTRVASTSIIDKHTSYSYDTVGNIIAMDVNMFNMINFGIDNHEYWTFSYSNNILSRVDYSDSLNPSGYYYLINYLNDTTQEFTFYDITNNVLANIYVKLDSKINPEYVLGNRNPLYHFYHNILFQASLQADPNGRITLISGSSTYYINVSGARIFQYNGNHPVTGMICLPGEPCVDFKYYYN